MILAMMHSLRLENLSLQVRLGCLPKERMQTQEVRLTIEFRFKKEPRGCTTDELQDTICYAQVSEAMRKHCESREFKLIERMAYECEKIAREIAGRETQIGVAMHKVRPPVDSLLGGATYRCGDFYI
jgi:dihydroneopterin aldolase